MSDKDILEKAIKKAIDSGLDNTITRIFLNAVRLEELDFVLERFLDERDTLYYMRWIFDKDFSKALWGEDCFIKGVTTLHTSTDVDCIKRGHPNTWSHHLQQMVIASDPIKYLGDNI